MPIYTPNPQPVPVADLRLEDGPGRPCRETEGPASAPRVVEAGTPPSPTPPWDGTLTPT